MSSRILHIAETLHPAGAGGQLLTLAEGLPRDDFEVHVCATDTSGLGAAGLEAAGVPVTEISARADVDPLAFWQLYRQICRLRPAVVHTCGPVANTLGRAAALAAGTKSIVVSRPREEPPQGTLRSCVDRFLNTRTRQTITTTEDLREVCLASGLAEETVTVIPSGIPAARESRLTRDQILSRLDLPAGSWLIGAIGPLEPEERLKELLWLSQLQNMLHEEIRLVVFGEGPQRAVLDRYVRLLDGEDYIRLPGDRDDLPEILPHLNLLWHTPGYISQPMAILQAMAAGVPVVASDVAGHRDLVVPGETGLLVPAGVRRAWAKATERVYHDEQFARRLGQNGQQRAQAEFRSEQMIERHVMLYRSLLDG